jgi:hypothetical protein
MKITLLTFLICINALFCFSQTFPKKQTLIPLSNVNGVPFYKDPELNDLGIDGFEIDSNGNFYFLGGDKITCLAVFSNNKPKYRKTYKGFHPTSLYIHDNSLYTFVLGNSGVNDLVNLNLTNGVVKKRYTHLTSKNIAFYTFADSSIVIETLSIDTALFYQYNLKGKYISQVLNQYNISSNILPAKIQQSEWELLGKWNDNFIFWNTNPESKDEKLCMVNKDGKVIANKTLPAKFSGNGYVSNLSEDRKVRNGSLFVLGRKGKYALITEVPLQTFFYK